MSIRENAGAVYPEGFDASCNLPAWAMRHANSIGASLIGNRDFDVSLIAAALYSTRIKALEDAACKWDADHGFDKFGVAAFLRERKGEG